jgi:hypothetical protein
MSTDETWRRLARKLREELGELIYGALNNPKVIEVLLNCPAGGGPRPPLPCGWWSCCASARTSWVGLCRAHGTARGGCRRTQTRRPGLTARAGGTPGPAPFDGAPATSFRGGASPVVAGASQTVSPADASGDSSPAPTASLAPVSTSDTAGPTTEDRSASSSDATSSNAAARASASAGSEPVPATSGTLSSYALHGRSAGTAQTIS